MRLHQAFLYTVLLLLPLAALLAADKPLGAWQPLVRTESWNEQWPDASGKAETRKVTAEVWTQAMQASLDAQGTLHIPARAQPYYLDGPLVLKSGHKLSADPTAEIRLKPNSNTCMVRNEHVVTLNRGLCCSFKLHMFLTTF